MNWVLKYTEHDVMKMIKSKIYGSIFLNDPHRVIVPETLWERRSPGGTGIRIRRAIMRGLKEFFCKIVTAVICFGMKVFSGNILLNISKEKNASFYPEMKRNKKCGSHKVQVVGRHAETTGSVTGKISYVKNSIDKSRYHLFLKQVFYWLQGPGDRMQIVKYSSAKKGLELKKKELFYLVPE